MRWPAAFAVVMIAGSAWARGPLTPQKCARTFLNDAMRLPAGSRLGLPPGCTQLEVPTRFDVRQTAHGTEIWLGARQLATFPSPRIMPPPATRVPRTCERPFPGAPCTTRRFAGGAEIIDVHTGGSP